MVTIERQASGASPPPPPPPEGAIRASPKRYLILLLFFTLASVKAFQWICFSSIANMVTSHYQVSDIAVNWTAVVFMITFLVLSLPVAWIMELIGLRNSMLIGTFGTNLGVVLKCFACGRSGFGLALFGHVLVGCTEPFFFSVYSKLAQVWFPDNEVALATAIGVSGDTLGTAIGFIVPSLMVGDDPEDYEQIERGLWRMFVGIGIVTSLNSLLIILFFNDQPKLAPGLARYKQLQLEATRPRNISALRRGYLEDLRSLLVDRNFQPICVAFGLNVGTGYAFHTLLNQIIGSADSQLPNPLLATGIAGSLLLLVGIVGAMFCGHLLDRFHAYKAITITVHAASVLALLAFSICLKQSQSALPLYLITSALGFFLSGCMSCGFDVAVELTYPKSEIMSSTLLNMSAQVFGIFTTFAGSEIVDTYGGQAGCWFLASTLMLGVAMSCIMARDYKRQRAVGSQQQQQHQQKGGELVSCIAGQQPHRWYHSGEKTC